MRITNRMIANSYMANLNDSLGELNNLNEKIASGRGYLKGSEDPAKALKALQVRQNLSRISLYQDNIGEAGDLLTERETALAELNSILTDTMSQISQGRSDTSNDTGRDAIAEVLKNYQAEIFDIANSRSCDKYIFGGSDMSTAPFTLNNGSLYYHGVDVDSETGFDEGSIYYDIGLGIQIDSATGDVIEGTAFNISIPGSKMFGTGKDANGISNNMYNLLGDIAQMFEDNDLTNLDAYAEKLETMADDVLVKYSDVGQKSNFIEFLSNRIKTTELNAKEKQKRLEGIDSATAIVEYNMQDAAYKAALAMGSKIISYSLLDYMS